jgi:hypothetical protein
VTSLTINEDAIKVTLTFIEKVLTYRKSIVIPLSQVRGATEDPTFMNESLIIRLSGAIGIPGLFSYGLFAKRGDRVFSIWRRGQNVLVLELSDSNWTRIVLGANDAKALAAEINSKLSL